MDAERSRLEAEYWQAAERDEFDALAAEVAVTYPVAGVCGSPEAGGAASGDGPVNTPLRAFAAAPATPGELAARASEWDRHARFGIWQVQEPETAPGVWCTELVSGVRRYAQFPAAALDGAAPWSVWLGALVPADGIWRSTGNGIWLSPLEGDAVAEYAEQAVWHVLEELSGVPRDRLPEPGEIRFGQSEPYLAWARWAAGRCDLPKRLRRRLLAELEDDLRDFGARLAEANRAPKRRYAEDLPDDVICDDTLSEEVPRRRYLAVPLPRERAEGAETLDPANPDGRSRITDLWLGERRIPRDRWASYRTLIDQWSHELISAAPVPPVGPAAAHNSTADNNVQPLCPDGSPENAPAWQYLLQAPAGLALTRSTATCST